MAAENKLKVAFLWLASLEVVNKHSKFEFSCNLYSETVLVEKVVTTSLRNLMETDSEQDTREVWTIIMTFIRTLVKTLENIIKTTNFFLK